MAPGVSSIGTFFFGPDEILKMNFASKPSLFFITVLNGSGISEYLIQPDPNALYKDRLRQSNLMSVNFNSLEQNDPTPFRKRIPRKSAQALTFDIEKSYPLPVGTVYTFQDSNGTIVYTEKPFNYIWRYVDLWPEDFKFIKDLNGYYSLMSLFKDEKGAKTVHNGNWGSSAFLSYEPEIWEEEGWQSMNTASLYKVTDDEIQTIYYRYDEASDEMKSYRKQLRTEGRHRGTYRDLLAYETNGETLYVSLYDWMNAAESGTDQLKSLWLHKLPEVETEKGERDRSAHGREMMKVSFPKIDHFEYNMHEPIPVELAQAVDREMGGGGDYSPNLVHRKIGQSEFILVDRDLYEYKHGQLTKLGVWDIKVHHMVSNGFGSIAAQDFTREGDYWYVADTIGNRILKLDRKFNVTLEYPLPAPTSITLKQNRLVVENLKGNTLLTPDLHYVSEQSKAASEVSADSLTSINVDKASYYIDPVHKTIWLYRGTHLYLYQPQTRRLQSYFLGALHNLFGNGKILPYGQNIVLVMDHKLDVFNRDGAWLRTIAYPRTNPDGIYDTTPGGENSYYLGGKDGKLYLVQGYRILEIDLNSGNVQTVFKQNYANLGKLMFHNDVLYFTLQSNIEDRYRDFSNPQLKNELSTEIVTYNLKTRGVKRFLTDGYYEIEQIDKKGAFLQLWSYDNPRNGTKEGTSKKFPLALFH
jgi:hypothetical protein